MPANTDPWNGICLLPWGSQEFSPEAAAAAARELSMFAMKDTLIPGDQVLSLSSFPLKGEVNSFFKRIKQTSSRVMY